VVTNSVVKKCFVVLAALNLCLVAKIMAEDVCNLFGEGALRKICGIESGVKVQIEAGESSSSSYCSYKWKAETKRKMKVGRNEIEVEQENKVMIIYPDIGSTPAHDAFEQSIKVYPDSQDIDSVGEEAVWSEKRKQLTAVVRGRLYHVHVDHHDNEEDQNFALQILEKITS
jgi:hypothetical protein